jgi:peptidoglycan/LPS O-acetylase OafA/YrhL
MRTKEPTRARRRFADRSRPGHGLATDSAGQQDHREPAADRGSPGGVALAIIVAMFVLTNEYSMWHFRGGILLLSLATAVLVGAVVHPASVVGPVLGVLPLRWIGERSYGIYLWHLPVVAFMPQAVLATRPMVRAGLQLALIILLSTLSWALLESPIRRHGR